jgi:hypothetical protein
LLNLLFRNVFDHYQKFNQFNEQEDELNETPTDVHESMHHVSFEQLKDSKQNKNVLIEGFENINRIM